MPRYKDLIKDPTPYTDADLQETLKNVEHELKGSLLYPIKAEPAIMERPPELLISEELSNLKAGLLEVKEDIKAIKEIIDRMDRNGLKMKSNW